MSTSLLRRLAPRAVVVAAVALSLLQPGSASAVGLNAPTKLTATATSPSELVLRWTPPAPDARVHQAMLIYDYTRNLWSGRWTCATCSSLTINGLTAGSRYAIGLYGEDASGNQSVWAAATATTPVNGCGVTTRFCVAIDTAKPQQPLAHTGSGLLHSATDVPLNEVTALRPRAWRIAARNAAEFAAARASGAQITAMLSDAFAQQNGNWDGNRLIRNPWDDWNSYRTFISDTVRWHLDNGLAPDWWEIQNEPNPAYYAVATPPTRALLLEQFRVAHDAIRAALPAAIIVGPSLGDAVSTRSPLIDVTTFLDYAVAQGLRFDVIAWHPLGGTTFGESMTQPQTIVDDAANIRQLIRERPSLGTPLLAANEYGSPFWRGNPGATVRYFDALERAGIASANLTCYPVTTNNWVTMSSTCASGLLDGLRTPSGSTAADYWTYVKYAAMDGTRVASHSDNAWVSAVATTRSDRKVSVLVGRAHNCKPAVQDFCPQTLVPDPALSGDILVRGLAAGTYDITVERIPNVGGAVLSTTPVSSTSARSVGGSIRVSLGSLADGDAVLATLTPRA